MGTTLGRALATTLAGAVAGSTLLMTSPADAVTTYTISGTVKLSTGAAADQVEIIACNADCSTNSAAAVDADSPTSTGAYSLTVPAGTYTFVVAYLDLQPGYDDASGAKASDGFLNLASGSTQYTVAQTYGSVTAASKATVSANVTKNFVVGAAIHNPQSQFKQTTPGTIGQQPCTGHTTTFQPTPFSDLPSNGTVSYQWYVGSSQSTMQPISGATGISYTSTPSQTGQNLYVEMLATAPNRVPFDGVGYLGAVGDGASCVPSVVVSSYGAKHGRAVHGKKVSVVGAKAAGAGVSYNWMLNGKVVHHGASYKLPAKAKRKKLTVQEVFSEAGYQSVTHVISFGKVK